MKKIILSLLLISLSSGAVSSPLSLGFTLGFEGVDNSDALSINAQSQWNNLITFRNEWALTGYWNTELNYFSSSTPENSHYNNFTMFSVTPNLRYIRDTPYENGLRPFIDAGFGLGVMNQRQFSNNDLGGYFTFRESIGFGSRFGDDSQFEISYHYVYLTNLSLLPRNDGFFINTINFDYYFL